MPSYDVPTKFSSTRDAMKTETNNQIQQMRSYLLGSLPEPKQIALERRFVMDGELLERMQEVEFGLVDSYVRGELPETDREPFERHYLNSPLHQERVALAKQLIQQADNLELPQPVAHSSWQTASFWQRLLLSVQTPQFAIGAAAMAVILLIGGIWIGKQRAALQNELAQLLAERSAEQQRSRKLEEQAAQQREQNADLAPQREQAPIEPAPVPPTQLSLLLLSTARGGSEQQNLKLPAGTDQVRLLMKLESGTYKRYQTNLRQVDGNGSWNQPASSAKQASGITTVSVKIPAQKLSTGDYILTLTGIDATGSAEEINRYAFRLIRQ